MKTPTIECINVKRRSVLVSAVLGSIALATVRIVDAMDRSSLPAKRPRAANPSQENSLMTVTYKIQKVGNVDVFYREAGRPGAPVLLLLHG
jgi:hypothetical protein